MSELKSKHAFGSEANVDAALEQGLIDAFDILFLSEGKIGWIDKDGSKVILDNKKQVVLVDELPDIGTLDTVYIYNGKFYYWNGSEFLSPSGDDVVSESDVDEKVSAAKSEAVENAKLYTDEQIASVESHTDNKVERVVKDLEAIIDNKISEVESGYEIIEF